MKEYLDKGKLEILKKEIGKLINEDKIDLTEEDLRKISGGIKNVSAKLTSSVLAALTGTGFFINNTFAQSDLPENMPVLNRQNVKTNNIKNEDSKPK